MSIGSLRITCQEKTAKLYKEQKMELVGVLGDAWWIYYTLLVIYITISIDRKFVNKNSLQDKKDK